MLFSLVRANQSDWLESLSLSLIDLLSLSSDQLLSSPIAISVSLFSHFLPPLSPGPPLPHPSPPAFHVQASWIKYHRELGIEHFFVYDISSDTDLDAEGNGSDALDAYVANGILSLIPWNYGGCAASTDPLFCNEPGSSLKAYT